MKLKSKLSVIIPIIIIVLLIIVGVFLLFIKPALTPEPEPTSSQSQNSVLPTHEVIIDVNTIKSEIQNEAKLLSQQSTFEAEATVSTQQLKVWKIKLPWTSASVKIRCTGTIHAGIDCSNVNVEVDKSSKTIEITLPKAKIISSEIDHSSVKFYDEKNAILNVNNITPEDTNKAFADILKDRESKAVKDGLLNQAELNASDIIADLVHELYPSSGYSIVVGFSD